VKLLTGRQTDRQKDKCLIIYLAENFTDLVGGNGIVQIADKRCAAVFGKCLAGRCSSVGSAYLFTEGFHLYTVRLLHCNHTTIQSK